MDSSQLKPRMVLIDQYGNELEYIGMSAYSLEAPFVFGLMELGYWRASLLNKKEVMALKPKPEKRRLDVWVNVYPGINTIHESLISALGESGPSRIACLHITREFFEGEGL